MNVVGVDMVLFKFIVDIFVYSGVNMCFGVFFLIIFMVLFVFLKFLYVIGFKGDWDCGVCMFW